MAPLPDQDDVAPAGVPRPLVTRWRVAAVASLVAHGVVALVSAIVSQGAGASVASPPDAPTGRAFPLPAPDAPIVVELPPASGPAAAVAPATANPPAPVDPTLSGTAVARVDEANAGKGGDDTVVAKATNLAPHAEDRTTSDETRDAIDDDQENRLETAKTRASRIDRRVALEPMQLTFVASGKGFRYERRPVAKSDASLGVAVKPSAAGGAALGQGEPVDGEGPVAKSAGAEQLGSASPTPKAGAAYGVASVGAIQIVGANVAKARPHVGQGKPSIASDAKGAPSDTIDGDQAVAAALKGIVSTSTAGGTKTGDGVGGAGSGGAPGAGGTTGAGSQSSALGAGGAPGDGKHGIARTQWYLDLKKRLEPLVAGTFPVEQELELRNGTVIVDLVIAKQGAVVDVIVVRPSGYSTFDQNVVSRLRGSTGFAPVPDLLSLGPITVRVPVTGGWSFR